ncbi:MAG TPA: hypothetical protein VKE69_02630 [Planctomycetota bacterium]|nr:hypothetical protein [Planctomycetota bacterium]
MSDSHGHGAAVADPHAPAHDAGHAHGGHGGGHGEPEPVRTPVPPHERTPWGLIAFGILVVAAVVALGLARDWAGAVKSRSTSHLPLPAQTK